MKYCSNCGKELADNAVVCPCCGCPVTRETGKQWLITFLLCFFGGALGLHRFYVGKIGSGVAMLLTLGGLGVWAFIDLIVIITGNFKDKEGNLIKNQ